MKKIAASLVILAALAGNAIAGEQVVLFDQGHRELFHFDDQADLGLTGLAGTFRSAGLKVEPLEKRLDAEDLSKAAAVVISGPFSALDAKETAAVLRYLEGGGKIVVMLHIGPPALPLLHRLGVAASNGVIHDEPALEGHDTDFNVVALEKDPLAAGVSSFAVHGGWALLAIRDNARVLARTSASSWVDMDRDGKPSEKDPRGPFGVIATGTIGAGAFAIYGDDAIFQNKFLTGGNLQLAKNLAAWIREKK